MCYMCILQVKSTVSHWPWCRVVRARSYYVTCLFEISDSLSGCLWKAIDMNSVVCNPVLTSAHHFDLQYMSQSLITSQGTPRSLVRASNYNRANSVTLMLIVLCIQHAHLKKWSTNVKLQSFPLKDAGTWVIKSTLIRSQRHCATGGGIDKPTTIPFSWLTCAHVSLSFV